MTTATAEPPTDVLTAADIIEPDKVYSPQAIEGLLTIPRGVTKDALRDRQVAGRGHADDHARIDGASVLAWIERDGVEYVITDLARGVYSRSHRKTGQTAEPEKTLGADECSIVDSVISKARQDAVDLQDASQDQHGRYYARYTELLVRAHDGECSDDDAYELRCMVAELELTPEQIAEDAEIVRKAKRLQALHADREAASTARRKAYQAYQTARDAWERQEHELSVAKRHSENRTLKCSVAGVELAKLKRARPSLFADDGASPPQLRTPPPLPPAPEQNQHGTKRKKRGTAS